MSENNSTLNEGLQDSLLKDSPLVSAAVRSRKLSKQFAWPMLLLFLLGPDSFASAQQVGLYFALALPVLLCALWVRLWSLGFVREKFFIVSGPYRYVRNPVELGALLGFAGAAILLRLPAWYTSLCLLLAMGYLSFVAIAYERDLKLRYGRQYIRYAERVRRWIPSSLPGANPQNQDYSFTRALKKDAMLLVWLLGLAVVFGLRAHYL